MGGRRDDQGGGGSTLPALPDLVDLPVTLASQPLEVAPHLFVELLDFLVALRLGEEPRGNREAQQRDRKSTRLNSSHVRISYAVFCLKKKNANYKLASH